MVRRLHSLVLATLMLVLWSSASPAQTPYYAGKTITIIAGTKAGDEVEVWFSGRKRGEGRVTSERFTDTVQQDIGGDVLILAAAGDARCFHRSSGGVTWL